VTPFLERLNQRGQQLNDSTSPFRPSYFLDPDQLQPYSANQAWSLAENQSLSNVNLSLFLMDNCYGQPDDGLAQLQVPWTWDKVQIVTNGFCASACAIVLANLHEIRDSWVVYISPRSYPPDQMILSPAYTFAGGQLLQANDIITYVQLVGMGNDPDAPQPFPTSATMTVSYRQVYSATRHVALEYYDLAADGSIGTAEWAVMRPEAYWRMTAQSRGWVDVNTQGDVCMSGNRASMSSLCDVRNNNLYLVTSNFNGWTGMDSQEQDEGNPGDNF